MTSQGKVRLSLYFNYAPRHEDVVGVEIQRHAFFDLGTTRR